MMNFNLYFDHIHDLEIYNLDKKIFGTCNYLLGLLYHNNIDYSIVGKDTQDIHLCYYPIKPNINEDWTQISIYDGISKNAIKLAKQKKLVFLFMLETECMPHIDKQYAKVRQYMIKKLGIPASAIFLVTGNLNYKGQLGPGMGFDFWHVNHQAVMQRRLRKKYIPWKTADMFSQFDKILHGLEYEKQKPNFNLYLNNKEKEKLFLSYNGNARHHRIALMSELERRNLLSKSFFSFTGNHVDNLFKEVKDTFKYDSWFTQEMIEERSYCDEYIRLWEPQYLDVKLYRGVEHKCNDNDDRYYEYAHYANSYFTLVTETMCDPSVASDKFWLTEKVFKPISLYHPFIVWGQPGTLAYLRTKGYETFPELFDESYDEQMDARYRLKCIIENIDRVSKMEKSELDKIVLKLTEKLKYNHDLFYERNHKIELTSIFEEARKTAIT